MQHVMSWVDAADKTEIKLSDIEKYPTIKWMVKRKAYGKIIKQDKHGIVIATDIDEDGLAEITTIPKRWINE